MRVPQPTPPAGAALAGAPAPEPSTRAAFGLSAAASASATILAGSLMARLTPEATTGLPANRPLSLTPTSVAKMTASAPAIVAASSGRAARRALRLDVQRDAGLLGGGDQRVGGHVGVRDAGRARGDRDQGLGRFRRPGPAPRRAAGLSAAGLGFTTPSTRSTTSSGVDALRSDSTKSLRTSARARLDSSFMCSAPPASGAAIRNARSAGPSGAPKSTARLQPREPDRRRVDVRRAAVRDRDAAGQPGGRLLLARHRGGDQPVGVGGASGVGEPADEPADHGLLVAPASTSSSTRSALMIGS